jgi:hypothetical protein
MRLGVMACCGFVLLVISEHYRRSVAPLQERESETLSEAGRLRERIADAQKTIAEIREKETEVARIREEIDQAQADFAPGLPIDAFPAWVKERFAQSGMVVHGVRLEGAQDEPDASAYERGSWSLEIPVEEAGRNIATMLGAVADIGERHSFVRVLDFEIRPNPEKPGARVGTLSLETVLRK